MAISDEQLRLIAGDDSWSSSLSELADGTEVEIDFQSLAAELLAARAALAKVEAAPVVLLKDADLELDPSDRGWQVKAKALDALIGQRVRLVPVGDGNG